MKYVTSRELAEKWNISQRRIVRLASEGKIDGARFYGRSWVFPENAEKPKDGRTRYVKAEKQGKDSFRYPLYEFRDVSSFSPPLTAEELTLKTAIEAFNAFRFKDAEGILGDLPEKAQDRYIRISALYCGCMICIFLCDTVRFLRLYGMLKGEFLGDFPHKAEMIEYLHEIDATLGENSYYSYKFNTGPAHIYHKSFLPRLCNLSSIWIAFGEKPVSDSDLSSYEIHCGFLESTDNVFDLQAVHVYLACAYSTLGRKEICHQHFHRALELAEKYEMFYNIASMHYCFTNQAFEDALDDFPEEFQNRVRQHNSDFHSCHIRFTNALKINSLYILLTGNDYIYIMFAVQGLSNKEVAGRMHVSTGTVGKRYGEIYAECGVKNKAEMIALYHRLTDKKLT